MKQVKYTGTAPQSNFRETARYNVSLLGDGLRGRLLDIGAYKGLVREWLPASVEYQGVDVQDWGLECIREVDLNASPLPFPDASFDYVLAANVIEHLLLPPARMVAEIKRVAKPGALVVISLPNDRGLAVLLYSVMRMFRGVEDLTRQEFGHHWQFDERTARALLREHFEIAGTRYHPGVYLDKLPVLRRIKVLTSDLYFVCRNRG
jgi:SAM-dependent methyltransferase